MQHATYTYFLYCHDFKVESNAIYFMSSEKLRQHVLDYKTLDLNTAQNFQGIIELWDGLSWKGL